MDESLTQVSSFIHSFNLYALPTSNSSATSLAPDRYVSSCLSGHSYWAVPDGSRVPPLESESKERIKSGLIVSFTPPPLSFPGGDQSYKLRNNQGHAFWCTDWRRERNQSSEKRLRQLPLEWQPREQDHTHTVLLSAPAHSWDLAAFLPLKLFCTNQLEWIFITHNNGVSTNRGAQKLKDGMSSQLSAYTRWNSDHLGECRDTGKKRERTKCAKQLNLTDLD